MISGIAFAAFVCTVGFAILSGKYLPDSVSTGIGAAGILAIGRAGGLIGPRFQIVNWRMLVGLAVGLTVIVAVAAEAGNVSNYPNMR